MPRLIAFPMVCALAATLSAQQSSNRSILLEPAQVWTAGEPIHTGWVVLIDGKQIKAVGPRASVDVPQGAEHIALPGMTVLPGLIDGHVHVNSYFNAGGRIHTRNDGDTPTQSALAIANNLRRMLMSGVTTVQSMGAAEDAAFRDAIADSWPRPAQKPGHGGDVLVHGQVRKQPHLLDDVADLTTQLRGIALQHAAASEKDVARAERNHAVDQAHRGGLARARRSDKDANFARADLEAELRERRLALARVLLGDFDQGERRCLTRIGRVRRRPLLLGRVGFLQEKKPPGWVGSG